MYTDAEIRQKQQLSRAAGLSGAELLDDAAAVKRDCNGIGAAWMPDATREWISTANPSLVVAADIHDRRYSIGGTEADRQAADAEFRANGMKMAKYVYSWYDPRRYWVMWQVWKFSALLTFDGAEIGGSVQITVDSELSDTSTNPVQNKVVKAALDGKGSGGIFYQNVFQSESIEIYLNPDYPIYQYTLLDTDNRVDLLVDNIDLTKGCITVELQLTKPVTNTNSITVRVRNKGTSSAKTVKWLDSTQSITTQGTYSIVIRTFDGQTWYANIAYLI